MMCSLFLESFWGLFYLALSIMVLTQFDLCGLRKIVVNGGIGVGR